MTKILSRSFLATLLLVVAALLLILFLRRKESLKVDTFKAGNGYGYSITSQGKIYIYQPFIPAVEGNIAFSSRSDARKAGKMVQRKLKNKEEPSLSVDDLLNAGIKTQN
jgi:hypothetical protein